MIVTAVLAAPAPHPAASFKATARLAPLACVYHAIHPCCPAVPPPALCSALAYATHDFFTRSGFQYVHTPIISASDCEGAGEMFQARGMGVWWGGARGC